MFSIAKEYLSDIWYVDVKISSEEINMIFLRNWYDWICIFLLIACIGTHIGDIIYHSTHLAQAHIRLMSITIVIVCFRLLKTSQMLVSHFGTIVQMFIFSLPDIINWFLLFCCIWLPFSVTFWVLYGGKQFTEKSLANSLCTDVESPNNTVNNCTTIEIETFKTFPSLAYWMYRLTLAIPLEDVIFLFLDIIIDAVLTIYLYKY